MYQSQPAEVTTTFHPARRNDSTAVGRFASNSICLTTASTLSSLARMAAKNGALPNLLVTCDDLSLVRELRATEQLKVLAATAPFA
jgi:hypothetical protein